ncbi:uncharacterized protein LOC129952500 [Eupeodes corollae]|uniref:uncharacterized protein LOC129952500 n=1 Tax=Eupeodes corollae TaxID=290404 RepID=UPI0024932B3C|nr:uncharacterized protein LOC129952500 [Eupeodes corollae]
MNFLTLQLGVALSLLVLIGNCGQTYAAPKPCKGGCSGTPAYNSGYTAHNPAVLSTPLGHSGTGAVGNHHDLDGVYSGSEGADVMGYNNIVKELIDLFLSIKAPINILS